MTTGILNQLLESDRVLIADGGMGTLLLERGLGRGECPELLNVERPDIIAAIHSEYIAAGADIVLTNTFGGTALRLDHYGLGDRAAELNGAAVEIARAAAEAVERPVVVAGSMGPTGEMIAPFGLLEPDRAEQLFEEQAQALAAAGADVLWIETMSSLEELGAAFGGAETTGLPTVTTMSFDSHGRTMMGVAPAQLGEWANGRLAAPLAVGANCGIGPEDAVIAVQQLQASGLPVVAKANCGLPQMVDGTVTYPLQPADMTGYATAAVEAGARIVGACCGSVPDHIAAIRAAIA